MKISKISHFKHSGFNLSRYQLLLVEVFLNAPMDNLLKPTCINYSQRNLIQKGTRGLSCKLRSTQTDPNRERMNTAWQHDVPPITEQRQSKKSSKKLFFLHLKVSTIPIRMNIIWTPGLTRVLGQALVTKKRAGLVKTSRFQKLKETFITLITC